MFIGENEGNLRFWFAEPELGADIIERDIILDYDGMGRIVGGEVLNIGDDVKGVARTVGVGKYSPECDVLSFWLLDDPGPTKGEVVRGKLIVSGNTVVGVEVPATPEIRTATLQLLRNRLVDPNLFPPSPRGHHED
ncbi:MAG: hypothetical protein JSV78_08015 [Phycisphaerales bacterium]|nr:MAG: hypothetical protein JSV78_08015 [Phycisphaerales bacterium]